MSGRETRSRAVLGAGPDAEAFSSGLRLETRTELRGRPLRLASNRAAQRASRKVSRPPPRRSESQLKPLRASDAGRARTPARSLVRRQDPHCLERPDDRRLCRRLSRPQERRYRRAAEKAAEFLLRSCASRTAGCSDLSCGPGQASGLPGRLCVSRPRPAATARRDR